MPLDFDKDRYNFERLMFRISFYLWTTSSIPKTQFLEPRGYSGTNLTSGGSLADKVNCWNQLLPKVDSCLFPFRGLLPVKVSQKHSLLILQSHFSLVKFPNQNYFKMSTSSKLSYDYRLYNSKRSFVQQLPENIWKTPSR